MPALTLEPTPLPGLLLVRPPHFADHRGFFEESWNRRSLAAQGLDLDFVQDNQSLSRAVGTLRGLHYQAPPHAQAKLVRVVRGRVLDVAVDVRRGSPTYGRWHAVELSAENRLQLLVPEGFLHGFVTREPDTEVFYKCSAYYAPDAEGTVHFADPELAIDWGLDPADAILSEKDAKAPAFADFESPFTWSDAP